MKPTDSLFSWPRPRYVAGGGNALVWFEIAGEFFGGLEISRARHNSNGLPAELEMRLSTNDPNRWSGPLGELLRESNPDAFARIESAPQITTIRGEIPDPTSLDYLRDTLGVVAARLDSGGVGVLDVQTLSAWSAKEWRQTFVDDGFEPTNHVVILASPEAGGAGVWLHTRGMRLFGRPDLSCRRVKPEEVTAIQPVFNGLIRMQAAGALIPEEQVVQGVGLKQLLRCHHAGDFEDREFNNVRLELRWECEC